MSDDNWIDETRAEAENPPQLFDFNEQKRPLRSRSYLTAVMILRDNKRDVLGDRRLELNEMTGRPELGRAPLRDVDVSVVRSEIERLFPGGLDRSGNEIGMQLALGDVYAAACQVAAERTYHPVRDYLGRLVWDGVRRIDTVVEDVLNADRSELNVAMLRRFLVSAVARVMRPGCKVDTVLVMVGPQGCGKSTFFRTLSDPWFVDTAVDIHDKDSFQVLRRAWIYEWAELEVLRRAKDAAAAKAFLSSSIDTYRPPYGHLVEDVPRSGVIVGSTNNEEFLTDDTGNRRFWPLRVNAVDLGTLVAIRDQLWAEAMALYAKAVPWWLSATESDALAERHEEHLTRDSWESLVLSYADRNLTAEFTTADVLNSALDKPRGQWSRGDEMRVASILKRAGYRLGAKPAGRSRPWSK